MKKLFFTLTFVFTLFVISNAQLGVRAGLNISSYSIKTSGVTLSVDSKIGAHFGIVNDFKLTDNITFRPGLLYSGMGGKFESSTSSINYLNIPLSFVYNFTTDEKGFFAELGPYVGFLLSAKEGDTDTKDRFNSLDFGVNVGLGYDLGSFIVGANYGLGLANIAKTEDGDDTKANNTNIAIYGIYQF